MEELRAISAMLDYTPTPELVRPKVPYKQVTEELVHWAIRTYALGLPRIRTGRGRFQGLG